LINPNDPKSIDSTRLSNRINHPTNKLYDKMAKSWFQGIKSLIPNEKHQAEQENSPDKKQLGDFLQVIQTFSVLEATKNGRHPQGRALAESAATYYTIQCSSIEV
jgi:hypothetical protein